MGELKFERTGAFSWYAIGKVADYYIDYFDQIYNISVIKIGSHRILRYTEISFKDAVQKCKSIEEGK